MARSSSREDVQDRILNQMERASRNSKDDRTVKSESLTEQLKRDAEWKALSQEEQLKRLSYGDWQRKVKEYLSEKRITVTDRCFQYATMRLKAEYQKFHQEGTPLNEVADWLRQKDRDLLNGF
jgi:hypothetical protein